MPAAADGASPGESVGGAGPASCSKLDATTLTIQRAPVRSEKACGAACPSSVSAVAIGCALGFFVAQNPPRRAVPLTAWALAARFSLQLDILPGLSAEDTAVIHRRREEMIRRAAAASSFDSLSARPFPVPCQAAPLSPPRADDGLCPFPPALLALARSHQDTRVCAGGRAPRVVPAPVRNAARHRRRPPLHDDAGGLDELPPDSRVDRHCHGCRRRGRPGELRKADAGRRGQARLRLSAPGLPAAAAAVGRRRPQGPPSPPGALSPRAAPPLESTLGRRAAMRRAHLTKAPASARPQDLAFRLLSEAVGALEGNLDNLFLSGFFLGHEMQGSEGMWRRRALCGRSMQALLDQSDYLLGVSTQARHKGVGDYLTTEAHVALAGAETCESLRALIERHTATASALIRDGAPPEPPREYPVPTGGLEYQAWEVMMTNGLRSVTKRLPRVTPEMVLEEWAAGSLLGNSPAPPRAAAEAAGSEAS